MDRRYRHDLFLYEDDATLAGEMAPELAEGLERGEAVVAVLDRRKLGVLHEALGAAFDDVATIDRDSFYTRPEAALAGYDARLRQYLRDGAPAVRVFGELPLCETPEEWSVWMRYESIVNRALAHHAAWITCGYDAREMPRDVLATARHTHPLIHGDRRPRNPDYEDPEWFLRSDTRAVEPLGELREAPMPADPDAFRSLLRDAMAAEGVPEADAEDMVAAAGEILANARAYGGGVESLRLGRVDGRFVCELIDRGPGIDDPLAGFIPPRPENGTGAGLWVARQLTRRLDLIGSPDGLTARLWV